MFCPSCNCDRDSQVVFSEPRHEKREYFIFRTRQCKVCQSKWNTVEMKLRPNQSKAIFNWTRKREKLLDRLNTMKITVEEMIEQVKKA